MAVITFTTSSSPIPVFVMASVQRRMNGLFVFALGHVSPRNILCKYTVVTLVLVIEMFSFVRKHNNNATHVSKQKPVDIHGQSKRG